MNQQTGALVNALYAVTGHIPAMATGLLAGSLPVAKQHQFAGLLIELGELLHSHADDQEAGIIPGNPVADAEGGPRRQALEPGGGDGLYPS